MNNVHWGIGPFHTFDRGITHGDFIFIVSSLLRFIASSLHRFIVSSLHRVIASSCHRFIVSSSLQPPFLDEEQNQQHGNDKAEGDHIQERKWRVRHRESHIHTVKS